MRGNVVSEDSSENIDKRLSETLEQIYKMRQEGKARSALRASNEVKRLARAEKKLIPWLQANFHVMNVGQSLLEPQLRRESSIESIALLESPERARTFQSDYSQRDYERTVSWMTACSYDNLAQATATLLGYNSDGMQGLVADGIGVCRRTGKLECIACFREYATAVFRSADDLEMALHHARTNLVKARDARNFDRRWVGAYDEADLLLLAGHLGPAREATIRALELAGSYHSPDRARRKTLVLLNTILLLDGREKEYSALAAPHQAAMTLDTPDEGESPEEDMISDMLEALGDCCRGEYESAIDTLRKWDQALTTNKALHEWFEVRLRLIAAMKMSGAADRAQPLAAQLESKAKEARDFLTLRRLRAWRETEGAGDPFLPPMPFSSGRFGSAPAGAAAAEPAAQPSAGTATPERGPLAETIDRLGTSLGAVLKSARETNIPPDTTPILQELLAIPPTSVTHSDDAARLLHMTPYIVFNIPTGEQDPAVWEWARAAAANLPEDAATINLLATLGGSLRHRDNSPLTEAITPDELSALFRKSLDLESNRAPLWARAGLFYLDTENVTEAERCLSRASRLDRSDETVALRLADLYARTDRPSDALLMLDLCLRSGTVTPPILWEAALLASGLQQNDLVLLYTDRFEQLQPGRPWVGFYRAMALLNLRRFGEASSAIESEAERATAASMPIFHVLSVRAAIAAETGDLQALRNHLQQAMEMPLRQVTNLSPSGIASSLNRFWTASQKLPDGDALRTTVEDRILGSGLVFDSLWRHSRNQAATTPSLSHFMVTLRQPLDATWAESKSVLEGQQNWTSYRVVYGVLAADPDQAEATALQWQLRCFPLPAEVLNTESDNGRYTDKPGVTQRRFPEPETQLV